MNRPFRTYVLDTSVLLSDPWRQRGLLSMKSWSRWWSSANWKPSGIITSLVVRGQALRMFDDLAARYAAGSADSRWDARRHAACRAEPQRPYCAAAGFRTDTNECADPDVPAISRRGQSESRW